MRFLDVTTLASARTLATLIADDFHRSAVFPRIFSGGLVNTPVKLRRDIVGVRFRRDAGYALGTLRWLRFRAVRLCSSSPRLDAARFDPAHPARIALRLFRERAGGNGRGWARWHV